MSFRINLSRRLVIGSLGAAIAMTAGTVSAQDIPEKPDSLIMRMWPGPWGDAMANVGRAFTEETGIEVEFDHRPEPAVSTLIQAALAQGRTPPIDIYYGTDMSGHRDTIQEMTELLTVEEVPNLANLLPDALPETGEWTYVNVAPNIMTLIYRESAFPEAAPTSVSIMADPAMKGRTFANLGSGSNIAMAALITGLSVPDDMDEIWSFIETSLAPMDPIRGRDPELVAGLQRKEIDLIFSFPKMAHTLPDEGLKIALADEGSYAFNEAIYVPRGLPEDRSYWAKQFVNFLISNPVLEMYCGELTIPCLAEGLPLPEKAAVDPSFPKSPEEFSSIYTLPLGVYAESRAEWDARFDSIMK